MNNVGRGIPISVGFDLGADMPLDARSTVNTKDDLNILVEENIACYGLTVFVLEDETYYQYLGNGIWEEIGRLGKVQSLIKITADEIKLKVEDLKDQLDSNITVTDGKIELSVKELKDELEASIKATENGITSSVTDSINGLNTKIDQTVAQIRAEVKTADEQLASSIEQTATQIRTEIKNADDGLNSKITQTANDIRSEVSDAVNGVDSKITQAASEIRSEIKTVDDKLANSITQTADSIRTEIRNADTDLNSKIEQTANDIRSEVNALDEKLSSSVTQSSTNITAEITDLQNNLNSKITQTTQDLTTMFQDGYEFGITKVNKDGIRVMHSGYDGYTEMKATGFYVNDGKEDVVSITRDGSTFKGKVYMNGGQIPSDYITGTLKAGQIDTDAITSTHIKAGSIESDKIATGAITSNKLSADAITGKTITGGSITGTTINNGNGTFSVDADGNLIAKNASISGTITGSTFSSNNDEFRVLEDGTVKSQSLVIDDLITTKTLNVDEINNPWYPQCMYEATTVYIDEDATDEQVSKMWQNEGVYQSIAQMLSYAPRNLGGYTLTINLQSNINSNISLSWFHSGQVNIEFNGHTVYGFIYCYGASMVYRLYGQFNGQSSDADPGFVMPYKGKVSGSYTYGLYFQYCQFAINNISIYPDKVNDTNSGGIYANRGARGCVFLANAMGNMRYLVRADYGSHVYVSKTTGRCNNATFCASTGGIICLNNNESQAGTTGTNPYWAGAGGSILTNQVLGMDLVTFDNAVNEGTNNNPGKNTGETVTVTKTVKAVGADTYRSTVYLNWKCDGTVRQGDYGYGDCQGCWFFGDSLYKTMNEGTVTKVVIRMQRQSGGNNYAQTMTVKAHNYEIKPISVPIYTDTIGTCSCAVGSFIDLVITDTATINKLKNCKGLGLSIGTGSDPYIVCSGNCQVIITYKKAIASDLQ